MREYMRHRRFSYLAICLALAFLCTLPAQAQCAPPNKIEWPAGNPVWTICWVAPPNSSGISGSGLELRHVFYKNKRVFWQAHVPVLNVQYDPGGCGGPFLSYRDWQNQEQAFEANNVLQPGYAEPTTPPKTVCDHPGSDAGTFSGVAVEKLADRLILTTQMSAGWYRYIQKWIFYLDGTIEPRFGFTAVTHPCTSKPHNHHVYWRFDFDVNGFPQDLIQEYNQPPLFPHNNWHSKTVEISRARSASYHRKWRVVDVPTKMGYEVIPGPNDGLVDLWGGSDIWALLYHGTEIDDGGPTSGPMGDAQHIDKYKNGEKINGQDVVMWYRASFRHASGPVCELVGPTLKLIGNW
jgi:hypothetical protein